MNKFIFFLVLSVFVSGSYAKDNQDSSKEKINECIRKSMPECLYKTRRIFPECEELVNNCTHKDKKHKKSIF